MGVIKGSCVILWSPSYHWIDVLVVEVDEVRAVCVVVGPSGNQSYPSIHGLYLLGSGGCYHHLLLNLSPFAGMTRVY